MIRRHPLIAYFAFVYLASAVALVLPVASFAIFPVLIAAVAATGLALTAATGGSAAVRDLFARMHLRGLASRWSLLILVPPAGVLLTLTVLRLAVSPAFASGLFFLGPPVGLVAGVLEEVGWTGFAYPRLRLRFGAVPGAVLLGLLWGLWHMPVVDSLGAATPHGSYWLAFLAAFVFLMTAVRCVICFAYDRTHSVLLAQLIHASSTASLIMFGAAHVSPAQEAFWYAAYGGLLWACIAVVFAVKRLAQPGKGGLGELRGGVA